MTGASQDLIPGRPALARGHGDGTGELEEIRGLGDHRTRALDAKNHFITHLQVQSITNRFGNRDLPLGRDSGAAIHFWLLTLA